MDPITYGAAVAKAKKLITAAQLNPYEVEGSCTYDQLTIKALTAKKNDVWILSEDYYEPPGSETPKYPAGTSFAYKGTSGASIWHVVQLGNRISNAAITVTQGGTTKGSFTLNQDNAATIALDGGGSSIHTYRL